MPTNVQRRNPCGSARMSLHNGRKEERVSSIDQSRNRTADIDHVVAEGLADGCHVSVRDAARAVAKVMDSIPDHADIPHMDFVVESRARIRLFRASLLGL